MLEDKEKQEETLKNYVEQQEGLPSIDPIGPKIIEVPTTQIPWQREKNFPLGNQIGWIPLPIK